MFDKRYLKKEYGLIAALAFALLVCYQLVFKKTMEAWQLHRELKTQLLQSSDLSIQPGYVERKNANLDQILNLYDADTSAFRNNTISNISEIAEKENVKLVSAPAREPFYQADGVIMEKLGFEGNYFSLMKALNQIQKTKGIGMIRSFAIKSKADRGKSSDAKTAVLDISIEINTNETNAK